MEEQGKLQGKEILQWHPAFWAGVQIELAQDAEYLEFESEHMLSKKPMQIDLLIIKKDRTHQVQKNIGRIFRTYNVVEYKSPDDYLSIDDFFKVYGYTSFYKADTGKVNEISVEELTITFVCLHYPRKMIKYLEKQGRKTERIEAGIYYISDSFFQIQLIVQSELTEAENLWLKSLTNELNEKKEIERLLGAYVENEQNSLYQSVMNVIIRANREKFGGEGMCEALMEIMEPYIAESKQEGKIEGKLESRCEMITKLVQSQKFTLEQACEMAEMSVQEYEEIKRRLQQEG